MKNVYLGDGVYAQIDVSGSEYPVILTTSSSHLEEADNVVFLEVYAMELLIEEYIREKNSEL